MFIAPENQELDTYFKVESQYLLVTYIPQYMNFTYYRTNKKN